MDCRNSGPDDDVMLIMLILAWIAFVYLLCNLTAYGRVISPFNHL